MAQKALCKICGDKLPTWKQVFDQDCHCDECWTAEERQTDDGKTAIRRLMFLRERAMKAYWANAHHPAERQFHAGQWKALDDVLDVFGIPKTKPHDR